MASDWVLAPRVGPASLRMVSRENLMAELMIATLNQWVIDFMEKEATVAPGKAIVVGQSGGGWGAIALSSLNPSSVRAIITFAAGRGGRGGIHRERAQLDHEKCRPSYCGWPAGEDD